MNSDGLYTDGNGTLSEEQSIVSAAVWNANRAIQMLRTDK